MRTLLLYQGDSEWTGVCRDSCENIGNRFQEVDSSINIITVTAKKLIKCIKEDPTKKVAWEKRIILVFPGGIASKWDSQLSDQIVLVKNFIQRGGNVFLVCAGAYFACHTSEFKASNDTYYRCRPLNLFPGKACGPLDPKNLTIIEPKNTGSTITVIDQLTKESSFMYFLGGGYFEPYASAQEGRDYKINHKYKNGKIASVTVRVENGGLAIMTFFHPEYDNVPLIPPELIDPEKVEKMRSKIVSSNLYRTKFFKNCLDEFSSSCNTDFMASRLDEFKSFGQEDALI